MPISNLNQIETLPVQNLSFSQLNALLDRAVPKTSFTGERTVLFEKNSFSLQNPSPYTRTTFEDLSKSLLKQLQKYPILLNDAFINTSLFKKFDLTQSYKNDIKLAKSVLVKLVILDDASKKDISKKCGFITRIFFLIRSFFNRLFSLNLMKANHCLSRHENYIMKQEIILKPFERYHKINKAFSSFTGIMTAANIVLSLLGYTSIPYISKTLNIATGISVVKVAYNHFETAVNQA